MLPSVALAVAFALPLPAPPRFDAAGDPLPPGALARIGTMRFNTTPNSKPVVSPDGKRVAFTIGGYTRLETLDVTTGRLLAALNTESRVDAYAFLTDDTLAVATRTQLLVWQMGQEPKVLDGVALPGDTRCIARSADGKRWAVGGGKGVHILSYPACESVATSATDASVGNLHFSPDGKRLIGTVSYHSVRMWDAATGKRLRTWAPHNYPTCLCFTADGTGFIVCGGCDVARYRLDEDTPDEAFAPTVCKEDCFEDVRLSADGKRLRLLSSKDEHHVVELDPATGKVLAKHKQADGLTFDNTAVLLPDDKTVLGRRNGRLWAWDGETGVGPPLTPLDKLELVAFAPDGKTLRTVEAKNVYREWNAATGKPVGEPRTADGASEWNRTLDKYLVPAGDKLNVHDARTGNVLAVLAYKLRDEDKKYRFSLDADDLVIVKGQWDGSVVWDATCSKRLFTVPCDWRDCVISADRRTVLYYAHKKRELTAWETASGEERMAAESPDYLSAWVLRADPDNMHFWYLNQRAPMAFVKYDAATGKRVKTIAIPDLSYHLVLSPDGKRIATVCNGSLLMFDTSTGERTHTFAAFGHKVTHVAFNADGTRLASSGSEGVAYVWDLTRPLLAAPPRPVPAIRTAAEAVAALKSTATTAQHGMNYLRDHPADGVAELAKAFPPVKPIAAAELELLLVRRDSADFKTRQAADKELERLGPQIEATLRAELDKPRSEEVRVAVERLLELLEGATLSGERLAAVRAVEAAERISTPDARKLLQTWAAGADGATLSVEAKAAVERK